VLCASHGAESQWFFSGHPPWRRSREGSGSGEDFCNKLGETSYPADLEILVFLLAIEVMGGTGSRRSFEDLFGSDVPGDLQAVLQAMLFWSSFSAATFWLTAISPSTKIAEGRLLRASLRRHCFFNLQARVPNRRPYCFIMVCSIFSSPSGVVPGAGGDVRALKLHHIAGGFGPDCNLCFQFRVLCAKREDHVVLFFSVEVFLVNCKTTASF
jgi:hypothetical protein